MNEIVLEPYSLGDEIFQIEDQIIGLNGKKKESKQQYSRTKKRLLQVASTGKTVYDEEAGE